MIESTRTSEAQSISRFPDHFYRMARNGFMSDLSGRVLFPIKKSCPDPNQCDKSAIKIGQIAASKHPKVYQQLTQASNYQIEEKPRIVLKKKATGSTESFSLQNPKVTENFKKSLSFMEEHVLSDPSGFFSQDPEQIQQTIFISHEQLMEGFETGEGPLWGHYRDFPTLVLPTGKVDKIEDLLKIAKQTGGSEKAPELYATISEKFLSAETMYDLLESLLPQERRFVETYIGSIVPHPGEIPDLMFEFAHKMQVLGNQVLQGSLDPLQAAATVHQKIVDIHPFVDGNGRLARLWMNIFLMLGGEAPVIFPNNARYTTAVKANHQGNNDYFKRLLAWAIGWNRNEGY